MTEAEIDRIGSIIDQFEETVGLRSAQFRPSDECLTNVMYFVALIWLKTIEYQNRLDKSVVKSSLYLKSQTVLSSSVLCRFIFTLKSLLNAEITFQELFAFLLITKGFLLTPF